MKLKDIIILLVYLFLLIWDVYPDIKSNSISSGDIISEAIILLLAFIGFFDIAKRYNYTALIPSFLIKIEKSEVQKIMKSYFKEEDNFLKHYEEHRVSYILSQLGINREQFSNIYSDLVRMRCEPLRTTSDAKNRIEEIICSDYPVVIDQDNLGSRKTTYSRVKYYINFVDIMSNRNDCELICKILCLLIEESHIEYNKIVIPYNSNVLLGVEVGKFLSKPVLIMRHGMERIVTGKHWDGYLNPSLDKLIIIHDVLVTGEQIENTINLLPENSNIVGFFCLIIRKEYNGRSRLEKCGIGGDKIFSICEINDEEIATLRKQRNNNI